MAGRLEKSYGRLLQFTFKAINPFKRVVTEPECTIHKFINRQALTIIKNDNYLDAYNFFYDYISQLNEGVVWADLDMKSSGHFYNPTKMRGLYGNKDALTLALDYYDKAIEAWKIEDVETAMFYLGATAHLIQDMTVPQHANIRLLDDHRQFEKYIRKIYMSTPCFSAFRGGYYMDSIEEYIRSNARNAMKIYDRLRYIKDDNKRFYTITKYALPLAQRTTAGCFITFYKDSGKANG